MVLLPAKTSEKSNRQWCVERVRNGLGWGGNARGYADDDGGRKSIADQCLLVIAGKNDHAIEMFEKTDVQPPVESFFTLWPAQPSVHCRDQRSSLSTGDIAMNIGFIAGRMKHISVQISERLANIPDEREGEGVVG